MKRAAKTRSWCGKSGKERRRRRRVDGDGDGEPEPEPVPEAEAERAPHIQVLSRRT